MLFANPETAFNVVKLSLYNHVLYCDDSSSMGWYERMDALKKTAKHVATIATALKDTSQHVGGLSIRFINYANDGHMNNIGTVAGVEQALSDVHPTGITPIGTQLKSKVLQPFIVDVLESGGRLDKPFLITIITDGHPEGESRDTLKNEILWCKEYMVRKGYGPWAVGFHIVQIGDADGAKAFLQEIEEDAEVRDHVYISAENIADGRIGGKVQQAASRQNELWWVDSLLKGIEH